MPATSKPTQCVALCAVSFRLELVERCLYGCSILLASFTSCIERKGGHANLTSNLCPVVQLEALRFALAEEAKIARAARVHLVEANRSLRLGCIHTPQGPPCLHFLRRLPDNFPLCMNVGIKRPGVCVATGIETDLIPSSVGQKSATCQ